MNMFDKFLYLVVFLSYSVQFYLRYVVDMVVQAPKIDLCRKMGPMKIVE